MRRETSRKLGEIAVIHYGKALREQERDETGEFPVFGSSGIVGSHSSAVVQHPTIIIGRKGSVGAVTYAPSGGWPIDTVFYLELRDPTSVHLRYLFHALQAVNLARHEITTSIPGLNRDDLAATNLSIPPLPEQKRIAAILDKADSIRRRRRSSIDELTRLEDGLFGYAFKGNRSGSVPIPDAVELVNGRAFKTTEWRNSGMPIIRIQNLKDPSAPFNYFDGDGDPKHRVSPGDLLMSWAGQLVSFGVYNWKGPSGWLNQHIFRVIPKLEFELAYLEFSLRQIVEHAKAQFHGIEMKHITKEALAKYEIAYPPLHKQREFSCVLAVTRRLMGRLSNSLSMAECQFQSLSHRAFRGEL